MALVKQTTEKSKLTIEEQAIYDELISNSFQAKYDSQIQYMLDNMIDKVERVAETRDFHGSYPGHYEGEVYRSIMVDPTGWTPASARAEAQFHGENYYNRLVTKADRIYRYRDITLPTEKLWRLQGRVDRSDTIVGTTYYADADNGSDANNGLSSGAGNAWATIEKFTEASRSAGDKVILRRGMTATYERSGDCGFTSDGQRENPLIIEADYDDVWGDFANSAQTYTPVPGAKTMTASATITGISVDDWVHVSTDDNRLYSYRVAGVSGTTLTLYHPYKGLASGSGKTLVIMPASPGWSDSAGTSNEWNTSGGDAYWIVQGVEIISTVNHTQGIINSNNGWVWQYRDMVLSGNGASSYGYNNSTASSNTQILKNYLYNHQRSFIGSTGMYAQIDIRDTIVDANSLANSYGFIPSAPNTVRFYDGEIVNITQQSANMSHGSILYSRNAIMSNPGTSSTYYVTWAMEDYQSVPGDSEIQLQYGETDAAKKPTMKAETTEVRSGGSTVSFKVLPGDDYSASPLVGWHASRAELIEVPIYNDGSEATYTFYARSDDNTDWDANPTASEFYIEAEYYAHATNATRILATSTDTVDFSTDETWQSVGVTLTPTQAGIVYLRLIYAKTEESLNDNVFYFDPIPVVT